MLGSSWESGHFMKNFRSNSICNITQDSQELQRFNNYACAGFMGNIIHCWQKL